MTVTVNEQCSNVQLCSLCNCLSMDKRCLDYVCCICFIMNNILTLFIVLPLLSPFINDQYFISFHVFIGYKWTMTNLFSWYHFLSITNVWTVFIASLVWWILFKLYWLYHIFVNDQCLDYVHCVTHFVLPINNIWPMFEVC